MRLPCYLGGGSISAIQRMKLSFENFAGFTHDLRSAFARTCPFGSFKKRFFDDRFRFIRKFLLKPIDRVSDFVILLEGDQIAIWVARFVFVV